MGHWISSKPVTRLLDTSARTAAPHTGLPMNAARAAERLSRCAARRPTWELTGIARQGATMTTEATPGNVRLNDGLGRLVRGWAEATGNTLHHGETLRGVTVDDLMTLASSVEQATREQCGQLVEGEKFRDGKHDARRGPGGVGTWHESSPMGYVMRELARCIRAA